MKRLLIVLVVLFLGAEFAQAGLKGFPVTAEWKAQVQERAPAQATAEPKTKRKVLLFSLSPGFKHWVIPHTTAVIEIMAEKSGAFEVIKSDDVQMFAPEKIRQFDAVILNNTCTKGPARNIFLDALGSDRQQEAAALEQSLIDFVHDGGGLTAIHGAIVFLNNSARFSELLGGSFDFHPAQQEVTLKLVEPDHPLLAAFAGKPLVHIDEPYLFRGVHEKNLRPLLEMDTSLLNCGQRQKQVASAVRYTAWIKRHGQGRVFYCSPSHNAQSFENPALLRFILDGIQYTLGDLECDDEPR